MWNIDLRDNSSKRWPLDWQCRFPDCMEWAGLSCVAALKL